MPHQDPQHRQIPSVPKLPAWVKEPVPMLGCTAGCKLIGADIATVGATGATGANTDIDGAAEAYTAGAAGEDNTTGCANMVVGVTIAPAGICSPRTWSTISCRIASPFYTTTTSQRALLLG